MTTRDIRPSTAHTACDVCGRTLLRGERAEAYLHGGARRWVCELCKARALHEGWIREGTLPDYGTANQGGERRRSLLSRLRGRRDSVPAAPATPPAGDGNGYGGDYVEAPLEEPAAPAPAAREREEPRPRRRRERPQVRRERPSRRSARPAEAPARPDDWIREPRHVRAVPTSPEHRTASAIDLFNGSEHPRTVAGVARSLGLPSVSALPSPGHPGLVTIVTSWELCWYRYEVDLSDEVPAVRQIGQGYELDELAAHERTPNAVADEQGRLALAGAV